MFDSLLIDRPDFSLSEPIPVSDQSAHEPDICLDSRGVPCVVWSERSPSGDRIRFKRLGDDASLLSISSTAGVECQPSIALDFRGNLVCAWAAKRDGCWHILCRSLAESRLGDEQILAGSQEGAFKPRILAHGKTLWLVFECVNDQQSRIQFMRFENDVWSQPEVLDSGPGDCFRPALSSDSDLGVWTTFDKYDGAAYQIMCSRLDHMVNPTGITIRIDRDVQSALTADGIGGHWVAWASSKGNRSSDPWWLTKYVRLVRLSRGQVFEPIDPMPARDQHNEDSFQGWEFPELAVDPYGRVFLFGQASHTLYAQYFHAHGWSDRFTIAPKRWGSWKPRVRVAGSNPIFIASMGLNGAQVQQLLAHAPTTPVDPDWPILATEISPPSVVTSMTVTTTDAPSSEKIKAPPPLNVYFGDLHAHSVYGDATGDVDEFYFRYRDAYGYDFAALTEHDYLDGMQLSRSELAMMWSVADRMTEEGRFVAFYGYEWTSPALADHAGEGRTVGEGHRHILYPDTSGPLISYGDPSTNTGKKLLAALTGHRALVIPHHTAWSGTDLDAYHPELSRLIEICSTHGRFEYPGNRPIGYRRDHVHPGKYVVDALARGHRVGFVGGSDSHGLRWHATEMEGRAAHIPVGTRVGWKEDAYRTGMTAILAPELSRSALFNALHARRCYATSGVKILLDFRVNDQLMGSEISVETQPRLTLSVTGTAPIASIELIRQGFVFESRHFQRGERPDETHFEIVDDLLIPGEKQYYYARIVQEDGNMAWSSPIWVAYD